MLFFYVALCACVRACVGNATSHVWPLGALAELLDNSQDRECGSTKVEVDAYVLNPSTDIASRSKTMGLEWIDRV